ncbi:MAG: hypothetical protein QOH46_3087 [Solirubrobacteraceae bacterium]|nr:hypothetical protein [Solirubrobacteraceae bacterium]
MSRRIAPLLAACVALVATAQSAPQAQAAPLFRSDTVEHLGTLPDAVGAIGARFSADGRTMYVTSATGLGIYDVARPATPVLRSRLALPHFENEDVDVGHVGGRDLVIITNDPSFSTVGVLYVIDATNPRLPVLLSATPTQVPTAAADPLVGSPGSRNGHIANCIQDCRYLWTTGSNEGLTVYDLSDPAHPEYLGALTVPGGGFTHDVDVDPSGIAWVTGEDGTFGYDTTTITDPLRPTLRYRSDPAVTNTGNSGPSLDPGSANGSPLDFLHHNSLRTGLSLRGTTVRKRAGRAGNVLAITEEDYLRPGCNGQGSLQTWQITDETNADGTRKLALLDMWTTELNELMELEGRSNPAGAPTTVNCSAHWFDEDRGLIAQGWYDQGVRFLDISDPRDIKQVGYFVSEGEYWAAYFAPSDAAREIVYGLNVAGGIDVIRIDRPNARGRVRAPDREIRRGSAARPHPVFGFACPLPQTT